MHEALPQTVRRLLERGVRIPAPASIEVDEQIDPQRISADNVTLHAGCRLFGRETLISPGCRLGAEGPVTLDNCQLGPGVALQGGAFRQAVFLQGARFGSCAHVREATLLEEHASAAHAVGLKQTILFPFVTLGSLINFCDVLMAGGSGARNHSEVGSSYIHFNFTPSQDKATASLLGDVPRGVMLDRPPIFLGGQGGLVGPCQLTFGTIVAAGTICRKDELRPGRLIFGGPQTPVGSIPFTPGQVRASGRIVRHNLTYIANLVALQQWYRHVRALLVSPVLPQPLLDAARSAILCGIRERIKRLGEFVQHNYSKTRVENEGQSAAGELACRWSRLQTAIEARLELVGEESQRDTLLEAVRLSVDQRGKDYVAAIQGLPEAAKEAGRAWLQGIVSQFAAETHECWSERG